MAKPYSQDLRDRVIDAVKRGEMSRRAAARRYEISESVAIKWLERVERDGSREPVGHGGHRASKLMPHRDFLEAARAEKSDVTLQALCDHLSAERGVKADTSMMSRFFRRIGVTVKKRPLSRASRIARTSVATANDGEPIRGSSTPGGWSSSMKPGPRPIGPAYAAGRQGASGSSTRSRRASGRPRLSSPPCATTASTRPACSTGPSTASASTPMSNSSSCRR